MVKPADTTRLPVLQAALTSMSVLAANFNGKANVETLLTTFHTLHHQPSHQAE